MPLLAASQSAPLSRALDLLELIPFHLSTSFSTCSYMTLTAGNRSGVSLLVPPSVVSEVSRSSPFSRFRLLGVVGYSPVSAIIRSVDWPIAADGLAAEAGREWRRLLCCLRSGVRYYDSNWLTLWSCAVASCAHESIELPSKLSAIEYV